MGGQDSGAGGRDEPVYAVEPLAPQHDRAAFSCGNDGLDRYLREFAGQDERRDVTRAFVLVETGAPAAILGYYTLSAAQVRLDDLPETARKRLPRRESLPAILLGRLAVDRGAHGRGFGRFLLLDAIERILRVRQQLGVWAVIVDAIDESAARFYEHHGFTRLPNQPARLYLPLKDAAAILDKPGA